MRKHLKPLFVQARIDDRAFNKVLVDGGAVVNLMSRSLLKKIGKFDADLKPHNIVLLNYERKAGQSMGAV